MTRLVIGGGELEKSRERARWVRTRLGAKPASFLTETWTKYFSVFSSVSSFLQKKNLLKILG